MTSQTLTMYGETEEETMKILKDALEVHHRLTYKTGIDITLNILQSLYSSLYAQKTEVGKQISPNRVH